jgi:GH15 family glucan-1,4-alpha-glucosidase
MTTAPAKKTTRRAAKSTGARRTGAARTAGATKTAGAARTPVDPEEASRARANAPLSPETQGRTVEAETPFPPIEEYAFLSDCHTGALVARDGTVEWLCVPSFDSPSIFGSLLDREAGSFHFGPFGIYNPTHREYVPGTNVLETTWRTPSGWIIVRDALTIGPRPPDDNITPHRRPPTDTDADHLLARTVECVEGHVEVEMSCTPAFDYGKTPAKWELQGDHRHTAEATGAEVGEPVQRIRLHTDLSIGIEGNRVRARRKLNAGEKAYCALSWGERLVTPPTVEDAVARINTTIEYWRQWLSGARIPDHRWSAELQRSALTIKGLTYAPTGAAVAALTTSLPETPHGERNWDYRYSWMRDATFTLRALHWLNLDWEADEFMQFLADVEPNQDGSLQIMYGINGERDLVESTLDDLSGYDGARPVRIGNGAYNQKQNDVFGAVLDSVLLHSRRSLRLPRRLWPLVEAQAESAAKVWHEPDQGIWEARGAPRHYVSSKLMTWIAMDRAAELAEIRGDPDRSRKWGGIAEEIRSDILTRGVSGRGVLRQHYDTDALDASTLLAALFNFLGPDDPILRNTVDAIANELTENGFVLRYRTDETDDGMSGKEGTFLICSFWLVSALARMGEVDRANELMGRLLKVSSPLGLYAEEFEVTVGHHLGNFPQAFSHLAMIEAAARIILNERLGEYA